LISVTEVLVTQWLVHVSFISVTEVLVIQWLARVSLISVTNNSKYIFSTNLEILNFVSQTYRL
jgi:hypothetical protein